MAYQNGTASDYLDLLKKLEDFAVLQGWTVQRSTYDEVGGTDGELILDGPGVNDDQNIIVGIKSYHDVGSDYYNWEFKGARIYDGETYDNMVQDSNARYLPLWNDSIPYWLICNKQRIALVAKVSTVYMHLYLGYINPYAADFEYDYPLLIGGSSASSTARWSNTGLNAYWASGQGHGYLWTPDDTWRQIGTSTDNVRIWPWMDANTGNQDSLRDTFGDYPLFPPVLMIPTSNNVEGHLGELDGVRHITGFSLGTEDIVDTGTQDYLVAQNTLRNDIHDFMALELA
ncbi:MAG: hypothetical protein WD750_05755 [Gammaproteobacteria bacterium]